MNNPINDKLLANKAIYLSLSLQERTLGLDDIVNEWNSYFNSKIFFWNLAEKGFIPLNQNKIEVVSQDDLDGIACPTFNDIVATLIEAYQSNKEGIFIIENIDSLFNSKSLDVLQYELLKTWLIKITTKFRSQNKSFLVLLGTDTLEWSLQDAIPIVKLPFATIEEVQSLLKRKFTELKLENYEKTHLIEKAAHILLGLTKPELEWGVATITNSQHEDRSVDGYLKELLNYKQDKLKNLGLKFLPPPEINEIGGMDILKAAIYQMADEFAPEARLDRVPMPKGWLLAGIPGVGKSWAAKVMAQILRLPMIYISIDTIKSRGASYLSWVLKRVEAAAPNIVYFDEFDKLFPEVKDTATTEMLGVLLTWLQEKKAQSFALATLNRLDALPPEITRAGRFDSVWYVGFPQPSERLEIFKLHLKRYDERYANGYDLPLKEWVILLNRTVKFTGAEIASIVEKSIRHLYKEKKSRQRRIEQKISRTKKLISSWIDPQHLKDYETTYLIDFSQIKQVIASNPELQQQKDYPDVIRNLQRIEKLESQLDEAKKVKLEVEFEILLHYAKAEISVFKKATEGIAAIENRAREVCSPVSSKDTSGLIPTDGTFWPEPFIEESSTAVSLELVKASQTTEDELEDDGFDCFN